MDLIIIDRFDDWSITEALFVDGRKEDISILSVNMIKFSISILIVRIME